MVNNPRAPLPNPRMLVSGKCEIRASGSRGKIANGPVYALKVAQQLLKLVGLAVVNVNADEDMEKSFIPCLNPDELKTLIVSLKNNHYIDSERCATTNGMTIDSDGYAIRWNRNRGIEWEHGNKIYVKFGFREPSNKCLVVSIHPSDY